MWESLLVAVVVWSILVWGVQRVWERVAGRGSRLSTVFMYGWATLLQQSTTSPGDRGSDKVSCSRYKEFLYTGQKQVPHTRNKFLTPETGSLTSKTDP